MVALYHALVPEAQGSLNSLTILGYIMAIALGAIAFFLYLLLAFAYMIWREIKVGLKEQKCMCGRTLKGKGE